MPVSDDGKGPAIRPVRLALLSNSASGLVNFRGPLVQAMVDNGLQVYALAPDFDQHTRNDVQTLGAVPVDYGLSRTGTNPMRDAADTVRLAVLLRKIRADFLLAYAVKPVVYGSLAARLARIPRRFSLITGLGYVFTRNGLHDPVWRRCLRALVRRLYGIALRYNDRVFFQNEDDLSEFLTAGLVRAGQVVLLAGTGVDLQYFAPAPPVTCPISFLFVGRMLREKGLYEFVEAARLVRATYPHTRFILVGGMDSNPGSVTEPEVRAWVEEGLVEWAGHVPDVRPWIRQASVFVLPSYREGKPRSTQEAMAMGRPVITTDAPGCRQTVENGRNGFLVPVRDPAALAEAMSRFLEHPDLVESMGRESRRMAEELYDVHQINRVMLAAMGLLPRHGLVQGS